MVSMILTVVVSGGGSRKEFSNTCDSDLSSQTPSGKGRDSWRLRSKTSSELFNKLVVVEP
jgi:hypothetical protein